MDRSCNSHLSRTTNLRLLSCIDGRFLIICHLPSDSLLRQIWLYRKQIHL